MTFLDMQNHWLHSNCDTNGHTTPPAATYTDSPFQTHGAPHRKVRLQQLAVLPALQKNRTNKLIKLEKYVGEKFEAKFLSITQKTQLGLPSAFADGSALLCRCNTATPNSAISINFAFSFPVSFPTA